MIKATKYTFRGMNQDITDSKVPLEFFFQANNIRFTTTKDVISGGIAYEKGNKLQVTIPTISKGSGIITYGTKTLVYKTGGEIDNLPATSSDQKIVGYAVTRDSTLLITSGVGMDALWEVNNSTYDLTLLYISDLGLDVTRPVQTIFNYENEDIQKLYIVDGIHQIRAINIRHNNIEGNTNLIDLPSNTLNFVANVNFSQAKLKEIVYGGNHTAGMIQYTYNLYRLNSSQTKIAPLSELITLNKGIGQGGGEVNEVVGSTPVIEINNIDTNYTHIKVYAIKYTSFNQAPSVSLIEERELGGSTKITIHDDGNTIGDLSLEQLIFLGSNPIIPQHIEAKDNILFPINMKEKFFDVDLDMRAYSFNNSGIAKVYDNDDKFQNISSASTVLPKKHPAINKDYTNYKYQKTNNTYLGGEGKYIKYQIIPRGVPDPTGSRFFKDFEVYRLGVQFYNKLGQISPAKWMGDYRMPRGNLKQAYNTLKVEFKTDFTNWLNNAANFASEDDKPVGYKILRAERDFSDQTILAQGVIAPMLFQVKGEPAKNKEQFQSTSIREGFQDNSLKIPSYLSRTFTKFPVGATTKNGVLQNTSHLKWLSDSIPGLNEGGEVYAGTDTNRVSQTFIYSKMMQFYSPEIMFDVTTSIPSGVKLTVKGIAKNTENGVYGKEYRTETKSELFGGKTLGGLNPQLVNSNEWIENNNFSKLFKTGTGSALDNNWGFVAPSGAEDSMDFYQWYRQYGIINNSFEETANPIEYNIYNAPEITVRGAGNKFYANDPKYNYSNSLQSFLADGTNDYPPISSINSYGAKCATIVLGNKQQETNDRKSIENLHSEAALAENEGILVTEVTRGKNYAYTGGIYGGSSYEDKQRTEYVEIGDYQNITTTSIEILSPGDTYVQEFKFLRIGKTDTEVYDAGQKQFSEIVSVYLETTVDLKNRHDISLSGWDARFQPRDEEYHKYNRVYSQEPSLVKNNAFDFTFRRIKNFDTRVMATKTKIPNETVDSWTDILDNTSMDLDGKYGPINAVVNFKDNLYTFQDNAFAALGINPRVQTQGNDGIAIELGTGATLYDYQYISTNSGSINKWGVLGTESGIYYLDGLNKSLIRYSGQAVENLSSSKGMHKYLNNQLDISKLRVDNPLLSQGVSMGYDQINNDVYLTYNNAWTLCFNEQLNAFSGFYDYNSPIYIFNKENLLTIDPTNSKTLYETHAGDYNMFYGINKESKLIFLCNPEPDIECTFNNIEYKSEAYNALNVEQRYTWEKIRVYNEFQNSGVKVIDANNMRKLNRKYRIALPRNANSTDRIRNTWAYIELTAANINKLRYVNHDIILYYVPNYVIIQ